MSCEAEWLTKASRTWEEWIKREKELHWEDMDTEEVVI